MSFRDYVKANLFDGSDEGRVSMSAASLLDELEAMFDDYTADDRQEAEDLA